MQALFDPELQEGSYAIERALLYFELHKHTHREASTLNRVGEWRPPGARGNKMGFQLFFRDQLHFVEDVTNQHTSRWHV
jgi:hypothetical protein